MPAAGRKRREAQSPESPQFPKKRAKREANQDIAAEGRYERTFLAIKTLIDGETVELPALLSRISQYCKIFFFSAYNKEFEGEN